MAKIIEKNEEVTILKEAAESQTEVQEIVTADGVETIGAYEILGTIGSGGMGIVYKVRHKGAGTVLAMKVLKQELTADPINVKRFQQELKTASLINHPNVLPVFDSGVTDSGCPYLVMEYLDGYTLEEILQDEGFLDTERFIHIFSQVCDALAVAHERRIIHRDLKPGNIMITTSESGLESVKVLDFGIARVFQKAARDGARLTQLGDVLGSPLYMSPEQCLCQKLDERSDIYSLGVVMYEALTGINPFSGESAVEIIMAHLQKRPSAMSVVRPDFNIPAELENLVFNCMENEASLRPEKMQQVSSELQRLSQSLKSGRPFFNFNQWQKRARFALKRNCRQLLEKRNTWMTPVLASVATACACAVVFHQSQPVPTIKDLIFKADGASVEQNLESVANYWGEVITLAEKQNSSPATLAQYHEEAADSIASFVYRQLGISTTYSSWNFLRPGDGGDWTRATVKRALLAKPHLLKALELTKDSSEQNRILEKLITVASAENDTPTVERYVKQRLKNDARNQQFLAHFAAIEQSLGKDKEAEDLFKQLLKIQESESHEPYPSALENLASLYHKMNRFEDEIKLRLEMIEGIKSAYNESYNYMLKDQYQKLAPAYRKLGRLDEARNVMAEAGKIKDN